MTTTPPRTDQHDPIRTAMWKGILATVETLPKPARCTSRTPGDYTQDGDTHTLASTYTSGLADGTSDVYEITVTVRRTVTNHDDYWSNLVDLSPAEEQRRVVVDGVHYMLGTDTGGARGFGGRRFEIEFFDGRRVTTTDLWYQGPIPPKWRETIRDNARFVTDPTEQRVSPLPDLLDA